MDGEPESIEQDETIVYSTMTVSTPPEDITGEWLDEQFPDADYVKAHHRVTGDWMASAGEEPTGYVCPECGEGTRMKRDIDGTAYYQHHDNKDCPRELSDAREEKREENRPSKWKQLRQLGIGFTIAMLGSAAFIRLLPKSEMTINGESVMIPPSGGSMWIPLAFIMVLVFLIMLAMVYAPGTVGRRGGIR